MISTSVTNPKEGIMDPVVKPWYSSKVILVNILMAVAMAMIQFPALAPVGAFIKEYFAELGVGWAVLNMILRAMKSNIVF